jgi:hypothetical protein
MKQEPKNQFDEFLSNVHKGISLETNPEDKNLEKPTKCAEATEPDKSSISKQKNCQASEKPAKQTASKQIPQEDYQTRFFTRVDFTYRKPLYITASTHRKLMRIVHLLDDSKATMSSYVENILLDHLEMFRNEIDTIYQEKNTNPTEG